MSKTPTTLIIMDGFGLREATRDNAIANARKPFLDKVFAECPGCKLLASGMDVGLPDGQIGNSEVGHTNIGAGRVVFQDLPRITKAIRDGEFFRNPEYLAAMDACKEGGTALHVFGLLSDGGVHSHISHIFALLDMAREQGVETVWVHCFLDGRDVSTTSGKGFVADTADKCAQLGNARIATVSGRFYAMDRDKRWERLQRACDAIADAKGPVVTDPVQAVADSYARDVTDEFVEPVVTEGYPGVKAGDAVIFMNFRPDRAREITRCFADPDFADLAREYRPVKFVCTTEYDSSMPNVTVAFPKKPLENVFGEYISSLGLTQLRIAETEKYAHVTFFFNGGQETVFPGEDRVLIPSPKVPTYDMKPDMSAHEVADEAVRRIESGEYDVVVLNFANCDMVGHTGIYEAARLAVEAVDQCVGQVVEATQRMGGIALITADHGNADQMTEADGVTPYTPHTTNPVPFYIVGANVKLRDGKLCDIAPTMLDLMGLAKPAEMDGESLIEA